MKKPATFPRRLLPALLLAGLALASCEQCKDRDPKPKSRNQSQNPSQGQHQCPNTQPPASPTGTP